MSADLRRDDFMCVYRPTARPGIITEHFDSIEDARAAARNELVKTALPHWSCVLIVACATGLVVECITDDADGISTLVRRSPTATCAP